MAKEQEDFQRARRPEQKRLRETAILEAARELAIREGIRNISLADIASRVGMHKSALLRYFETREDIYLRLGIEAWQEWATSLGAELESLEVDDVKGVAEAFGRTLQERAFLCDIFTHSTLNLERNVSVETVFGFKLASHTAIRSLANALRTTITDLTVEECEDIVGALAAMGATLWQMVHPAPAVAQVYAENPSLTLNYSDFAATIARFGEILVLGTRARRQT